MSTNDGYIAFFSTQNLNLFPLNEGHKVGGVFENFYGKCYVFSFTDNRFDHKMPEIDMEQALVILRTVSSRICGEESQEDKGKVEGIEFAEWLFKAEV